VNFASERGLLGIALHPDFPANPGVYLCWTCRSTALPADPFFPDERTCFDANMLAADSGERLQVPCLAIASIDSPGMALCSRSSGI
jgi:hypothetical protein